MAQKSEDFWRSLRQYMLMGVEKQEGTFIDFPSFFVEIGDTEVHHKDARMQREYYQWTNL